MWWQRLSLTAAADEKNNDWQQPLQVATQLFLQHYWQLHKRQLPKPNTAAAATAAEASGGHVEPHLSSCDACVRLWLDDVRPLLKQLDQLGGVLHGQGLGQELVCLRGRQQISAGTRNTELGALR